MRHGQSTGSSTTGGLVLLALLALGLTGLAPAQEGGGAGAVGAPSPPPQGPRVVWDFEEGDFSFDDVVYGGGVVFALDRRGKIHALDAAEGDLLWTSEGKESFSYGFGLAFSDRPDLDAVIVGCDTGLFALDRATGHELWRTEIALGVAGPACAKTTIVAGGADGHVYGFDIETGKVVWKHDYLGDRPDDPPGFDGDVARFEGRPARPMAAASDGRIAVLSVFDQCRTLAVDAATGERLWDFRSQGWMRPTPTIGADQVFVGSQDRHFYAVDKATGELRWKLETGSRVSGSARLADGTVYFGSCDANLYAVDAATGEVSWKLATEHEEGRGAPIYSRPFVLGSTVYLAAMRGKVYAVDRATGALQWSFQAMTDSEVNSDLVSDGERLILTTRPDGEKGESTVIALSPR